MEKTMTFEKKIRAIRSTITLMGGTTIGFDGNFKFGGLSLYDIGPYGELIFVRNWENRFGGEEKHQFPLHFLSERFLANVFFYYLAACKEQLTESGFETVLDQITD